MNINTKQAILLQINKLKTLPALPEPSLRIVSAINDPLISTDKLASVLALSPGLVVRLLGLANSAYFGQSRNVTDLSVAVYQILGLDLVKSLTLGIILNVQFNAKQCPAFNTRYFWMRSLLTAVAAQKIASANKMNRYALSTVYTSGLLLFVGMLVLAYLLPEEMDSIISHSKRQSIPVTAEIETRLGDSHYIMGYHLLAKWQLPLVLQTVVKFYNDPDFHGEERELINLLKLSQRLSAMLLNKNAVDLDELHAIGEDLAISTAGLAAIVDFLSENRENIQTLADIIGKG
ncbi:HDOD domain-containing protein [Methylomonas sp. AM2-LC]|uniref:HDOD domain-containing protein n=1 Tax=Methylomonas sp. AM2-LC TaxID=3153301 RepID=UPI003266D5F8